MANCTDAGSEAGRQGVQDARRAKASLVGLVMASALGIDCMQPESATPVRHTAVRIEFNSIFAAPAVEMDREPEDHAGTKFGESTL